MTIPSDWGVRFVVEGNGALHIEDPRGICPHCRNASTFQIQSSVFFPINLRHANVEKYWAHLILKCNSNSCGKVVYVLISSANNFLTNRQADEFFIYPSRAIAPSHPSLPPYITEDWTEAQKAMEAGAPKAAAVMCRRVLYGALLDKKCKEHPLTEGLKQLISEQRLPAIFDDWLLAIKDDGHDAAHPHRALQISEENVLETMEYTEELLRFLYIEPYEFQQRKARNASKS